MSKLGRGGWLVVGSIVVSVALSGVYLAAGGTSYAPAKTQDPCKDRPWRDPGDLQEIAEQFSLSALDGAACQLGVSREALAQALATPEAREQFTERYDIDDPELARAIRSGLIRAIDDAEQAGALSPFLAEPLKSTVRQIPLDQAIELIQNARSLLDGAQSFFGPAQGLLDQFLP
ncbi:MAG TPA: hypothetical protein VF176_02870 [Solirubrobacterales bacterium]